MKLGYIAALLVVVLLLVGCTVPEAAVDEEDAMTDEAAEAEVEVEPAKDAMEEAEEVMEEAPGDSVAVTINERSVDPETVTIKAGGTVTWTKTDNLNHQIKDLGGMFNSGQELYGEGTTFSYAFETAGEYQYRDTFSATGTVIVE